MTALPEYIKPVDARRAAGVSPSTFEYWCKSRPWIMQPDSLGRGRVHTEKFLALCRKRYAAKLNNFGKYSNALRPPEEIEREILRIQNSTYRRGI